MAPWTTPSVTRCGDVVGDRREEAGLGELGDERRVEAHDVDRGVLGRQAADQLLALRGASRGAAATVSIVYCAVGRRRCSGWRSPPGPPESGLMYQVSVGGPPLSAPAGGQRAGRDQERRGARDAAPADLPPRPGARRLRGPDVRPGAFGIGHRLRWRARRPVVTAVSGEWCRSQRVSIRTGAGPRIGDRTETASRAQRQSSPTRPAITDGVVTSAGVCGSTVAK